MITYDFFSLLKSKELQDVPTAITIGVFDGVHKGHEDILSFLNCYKNNHKDVKTMVITFNLNPKIKGQRFIDTLRLRKQYISSFNTDFFTVIDFCEEISKISGNEFIRLLCTMCRVKAVIVGEDFKCGTPTNQVTAKELKKEFASIGNTVDVFIRANVMNDQVRISSTLIRELIQTGDFDKIKALTGRFYTIDLDQKLKDGEKTISANKISQLLPPSGFYKAILTTKNGNNIDCKIQIKEDSLEITPPLREGEADYLSIITKEL